MPIEDALRARLRVAMRERDAVATSAVRSALAAIADAEAVAPGELAPGALPPAQGSSHVAGAHVGLGAAEVPRRERSEAQRRGVVVAEVAEREDVALEYDALGRGDAATRLRAEADVLRAVLDSVLDAPGA